jgi:hypothetical protein
MNAGHRRAALALSALARRDRAWLLKNLSSEDRVSLGALLGDLDRQGIKVPPSELTALLQEQTGDQPVPEKAPPRLMPLQRLAAMSATQVLQVLWCEPDWLIALVCGITRWQWLPEFLQMLEAARASQVQQYMRSQVVDNPAACEALVAAVVLRIDRVETDEGFAAEFRPAQRKRQSTFARLTSWLL